MSRDYWGGYSSKINAHDCLEGINRRKPAQPSHLQGVLLSGLHDRFSRTTLKIV
ncbi:MAG: hypothetical protein NW703_07535 [Nitrospiraceae bacterium]